MRHVDFEFLNQFIRGEMPVEAVLRTLLAHLAERCPECRAGLSVLVDEVAVAAEALAADRSQGEPVCDLAGLRAALPDPRFVGSLDKLDTEAADWARRVRAEKKRARADLRALRRLPQEARAERIRSARSRFRSRAFAELLLAEARRLCRAEPLEAAALAELVPVALLWIPGAEGQLWSRTVALRASAWRANALRVAGQLRQADAALALLRAELARRPVEDPLVYAEAASLEASLRMNQQQWRVAGELLREAEALYRIEDDRREVAKIVMKLGVVEQHLGDLEAAVVRYRQALDALDPAAEPHLFLCALSNLALALCDVGRFRDSERLLAEHEPVYRQQEDAWSRPLERWMRGRIAAGLGRVDEAESSFVAARADVLGAANGFDAALISFDLAALYLEQGRTAELKQVARAMRDLFAAEGLADRALAALALFQRAVAAETVTVAAIRSWRRQVEREGQQGMAQERVA
jgi:tetratricopeptide (TPR) repeat protein